MPYSNAEKQKEYQVEYYKRKSLCLCGNSKHPYSESCRKCYDKSRKKNKNRGKQDTQDAFTLCTTCNGRMSVHRAQCVACAKGAQTGTRRVGSSSSKTINSYLACPPMATIVSDALIYCWYYKYKRINILAPNRATMSKYIKKMYKGMPNEAIGSVCRISEININLTDIDITQWKTNTI